MCLLLIRGLRIWGSLNFCGGCERRIEDWWGMCAGKWFLGMMSRVLGDR